MATIPMKPVGGVPSNLDCQPWAVSNGIADWSEGCFGAGVFNDAETVNYTRTDIYDKLSAQYDALVEMVFELKIIQDGIISGSANEMIVDMIKVINDE